MFYDGPLATVLRCGDEVTDPAMIPVIEGISRAAYALEADIRWQFKVLREEHARFLIRPTVWGRVFDELVSHLWKPQVQRQFEYYCPQLAFGGGVVVVPSEFKLQAA